MIAESQNFCPVVAVVRDAEEVAITAESGTETRRDAKPMHLRSQQDLCRVDGTRGHDYVVGGQREGFAVAKPLYVLAVKLPAATGILFHPLDLRLSEDLRSTARGQRQVIHRE